MPNWMRCPVPAPRVVCSVMVVGSNWTAAPATIVRRMLFAVDRRVISYIDGIMLRDLPL
jgi:hypothetical protein